MRKSTKEYWNTGYARRGGITPIDLDHPLSHCDTLYARLFAKLGLRGKSVVEIGGGGSAWLARLALDYPDTRFTCFDYAPEGNALIRDFGAAHALGNLAAVQGDMFDGPANAEQFDIVYSIGVVEHFEDLAQTMAAISAFCRPGGRILTFIPNMAGSLGTLTRRYAPDVYAIHNPHDLASFCKGHEEAGLLIEEAGYLGSSNFGVLSSCFTGPSDQGYSTYLWLSRLSRVVGKFESRGLPLPTSRMFSPYIYAIARPAP